MCWMETTVSRYIDFNQKLSNTPSPREMVLGKHSKRDFRKNVSTCLYYVDDTTPGAASRPGKVRRFIATGRCAFLLASH